MHDRSITGREAFSNVMGKYLIRGAKTARRRRGEERRDLKNHLEFIYAVDSSDGSTLTHTCDPTQLGSYRDNSRLHELTPVYFSREVLSRYANEPGRYQVTGGRISCLHLWGLDISTNTADLVEVPHQLRCLEIDLDAVIDAAASPSSPSPAPAHEPTAAPPATPRAA